MKVVIDVPDSVLEKLQRQAALRGLSRSKLIRFGLEAFCAKEFPVIDKTIVCEKCKTGDHCGGGVIMQDPEVRWNCVCPTCVSAKGKKKTGQPPIILSTEQFLLARISPGRSLEDFTADKFRQEYNDLVRYVEHAEKNNKTAHPDIVKALPVWLGYCEELEGTREVISE